MSFFRLSAIKASADVVSGILNWVCPECGGRMGAAAESSSARGNVRRTGVSFGSGFSQLDIEVEWACLSNGCDYALPSPTAQYRREQFGGSS
jgi:hypothetical protein